MLLILAKLRRVKPALLATVALMLASCGHPQPIRIHSDPNQEALDRLHDKTETDDIEIFIRNHPELDAETKQALREGTVSRSAVAAREKRK